MNSNLQQNHFSWQNLFNEMFPSQLPWKILQDYLFIFAGAILQALALRLFLVPSRLVSGGISGAAQLINAYVEVPIGLMILLGNLPLFFIGWRYLGGFRFAWRTALAILLISIATDILVFFIPGSGVTDDLVLNTLYGGLVYGFGSGLVYRAKGTSGGSDILGRILNARLGIPISQSYLVTDSIVVLLAGFVFGWKLALYGLVMLYVSGLAAEVASEGSGIFRTAMIVTGKSEQVKDSILEKMQRGVTILNAKGAYSGMEHPVLYCVITRAEVNMLKEIVVEADPGAFMVIGTAHEVLGEGFKILQST